MAIAGLVLAFFFPLLGFIFSLIGLRRAKSAGGSGRGLALAGLVISTLNMLVTVITVVGLVFLAVPAFQRSSRDTLRNADVGQVRATIDEVYSQNSGNLTEASLVPELESTALGFDHYGSRVGTDLAEAHDIYVLREADLEALGEKSLSEDEIYVILGASCEDVSQEFSLPSPANPPPAADDDDTGSESDGDGAIGENAAAVNRIRRAAVVHSLELVFSAESGEYVGHDAYCVDAP